MLDQAFEALKTYDWGDDPKVLQPIEEAVVTTRDDPAARKDLETRLINILKAGISRDAKDYVCRKLRVVGTAACVPALATMLEEKDNSHMARYALERIPLPEAAAALRGALPKVTGELKVGVLGSLGTRQDAQSVAAIAGLLQDADPVIARSAALALGAIRSPEAAKAIQGASSDDPSVQSAMVEASLTCAESLLAAGKKAQALLLYKSLSGENQPKYVKLAVTRGMLACAGKSE